jgi:hypothetical protein
MYQANNHQPIYSSGQQGGMGLRILIAFITLAILAAVVVVVVGSFQKTQQTHLRKATQISEYGLLQVLDKLQATPSWRAGFDKVSYEDGWYRVTCAEKDSSGTIMLTVASEGHSGPALRKQICVLSLSIVGPDSIWVQQSIKQE